jgi:hypothetical protein
MSEHILSEAVPHGAPRKTYEAPALKRMGGIGDVTQGAATPVPDFDSFGSM